MKIVTKSFENIADIQIFPIIGLIIFLIMFVVLLHRVLKLTKFEVNEYSQLPLDNRCNENETQKIIE